jgi:two-component system nitrogen regulation response regulator GlnG
MAAIPRELIESELFGHEKGAFTGAHSRSRGRFEQASGGTLFLDEIGDMPVEAQTRLLRVLQSGEYSPIGSAQSLRANVRILAATNQNLLQLVASGRFRDDLYYRLNVIPIDLPPLRERRSDIPLLIHHFLSLGVKEGLPEKHISDQALGALSHYDWPGNVRELSNTVQRLALLTRSHRIEEADVRRLLDSTDAKPEMAAEVEARDPEQRLAGAVQNWVRSPEGLAAIANETLHDAVVRLVEQELIDIALDRTGGNQIKAASILGINRNTLRLKRRG